MVRIGQCSACWAIEAYFRPYHLEPSRVLANLRVRVCAKKIQKSTEMKGKKLGRWNDYTELKIRGILHTQLYILNKTKSLYLTKMLKIMYFADQKHLVEYGITTSGDDYHAMEHGPVSSNAYDIINCVRHNEPYGKSKEFLPRHFGPYLEVTEEEHEGRTGVLVNAKQTHNPRSLCKSGLKFLDEFINKYKDISASEASFISHDKAWEEAWEIAKNLKKKAYPMGNINIAEVAGASEHMVEHMEDYYSRTEVTGG